MQCLKIWNSKFEQIETQRIKTPESVEIYAPKTPTMSQKSRIILFTSRMIHTYLYIYMRICVYIYTHIYIHSIYALHIDIRLSKYTYYHHIHHHCTLIIIICIIIASKHTPGYAQTAHGTRDP